MELGRVEQESKRVVDRKESEEVGKEIVGGKELEEREPGREGVEEPKEKKLKVYSRGTLSKRKTRETSVTTTPSLLPFSLSDNDSGNSSDIPIAVRKDFISCTQHPISNFVSYYHLFASYNAFLSKISSISVPTHA